MFLKKGQFQISKSISVIKPQVAVVTNMTNEFVIVTNPKSDVKNTMEFHLVAEL